MEYNQNGYPNEVNLDNCAKEPIHIIGSTQEFGLLLVVDPNNYKISQVGSNVSKYLPWSPQEILGKNMKTVFGNEVVKQFREQLEKKDSIPPMELTLGKRELLLLARLVEGHLLLDLEPLNRETVHRAPIKIFTAFRKKIEATDIFQKTTNLAKQYFGYDRIMIYKFDEEWNGEVVAEARESDMESWQGLQYPASDIPKQSRAMFLKNGMRMISDVNYAPVPIFPEISPVTGAPLNISASALRAVSPIHIEYLKNMEVGASLTAAIEVQGKLWGLIACHHRTPKFLDYYQRENCHFLSRLLAMELAVSNTEKYFLKTAHRDQKREQLIRQIKNAEEIADGLCKGAVKFTDLFSCGGGALYIKGAWHYLGNVPCSEDLQELLDEYLMSSKDTLLHTNSLRKVFPKANEYRKVASGLLSLKLAENKYLLWFRPEVLQSVNWGGDPNNKAFYNKEEERLSPRKSFDTWTELKQGFSLPWQEYDLNAAKALGENLSYEFLARQRNEIEHLYTQLSDANKELELFSYGLSHDLRAPLRGIEGLLDVVLEDHGEGLDTKTRHYLEKTVALSKKMEGQIDDILSYSQMSHSDSLKFEDIDTASLLEEVLELISAKAQYPLTHISVQKDLPNMYGDRNMLVQVWSNLLTNALKYSQRTDNPKVEIASTIKNGQCIFFIKDNGIGFPKKYSESIFEPFKRAVGEAYTGTGIGLALVRKIIEKHNGRIWAKSASGKGSIFYFILPKKNISS